MGKSVERAICCSFEVVEMKKNKPNYAVLESGGYC